MIESNDGKINSSGLVGGLSRADLPAGRARSGHAQGSDGPTPSMRTTGASDERPNSQLAHDVWDRGCECLCVPVATPPAAPTSRCS